MKMLTKKIVVLLLLIVSVTLNAQYFDSQTRRAIAEEEEIRENAREGLRNIRNMREKLKMFEDHRPLDQRCGGPTEGEIMFQRVENAIPACQAASMRLMNEDPVKWANQIRCLDSWVAKAREALADGHVTRYEFEELVKGLIMIANVEQQIGRSENGKYGGSAGQRTYSAQKPVSFKTKGSPKKDSGENTTNTVIVTIIVTIIVMVVGWFMTRKMNVIIKRAIAYVRDGVGIKQEGKCQAKDLTTMESDNVYCPHCGCAYVYDPEMDGLVVKCESCGEEFVVRKPN